MQDKVSRGKKEIYYCSGEATEATANNNHFRKLKR